MDIHIEVMDGHTAHGALDVANRYDVDRSPLAMPKHIAIGKMGTDVGGGHDAKIMNYGDQVDEYAIWLGEMVRKQDPVICGELEIIFDKAQGHGVILTTECFPHPYVTHAHAIKQQIVELAASLEG